MTLCQVTLLFVAGQTTLLREKTGVVRLDEGAGRRGVEQAVQMLAGATAPVFAS